MIHFKSLLTIELLVVLFLVAPFAVSAQSYEEWVEKSYDYLDKNDLPAAEECLKSAMRLEPGNATNYALLSNLGTIQRRQGKYEEAILSYTTALSRHFNDKTILHNRASLYSELGETEKAIADYTVLLTYEEDNQEALYNRGLLFLHQKNFVMAEADFDKLLSTNEKSVRARMGYALLEKLQGNYEASERIYNYLIEELPNQWLLYEGRADLYFMMGKNARAMADINKLFVELEPTASHYVLRGKIRLAQYEKERAKQDFLKALDMGYDKAVIDELMKFVN